MVDAGTPFEGDDTIKQFRDEPALLCAFVNSETHRVEQTYDRLKRLARNIAKTRRLQFKPFGYPITRGPTGCFTPVPVAGVGRADEPQLRALPAHAEHPPAVMFP
ncbi:MAG: hypothetical protein NVS3B24_03910 [Candidatus Dormibacteria bacterium]